MQKEKEKSSQWHRAIAVAPLEAVEKMTVAVFKADRSGALHKLLVTTLYAKEFEKANKLVPEYLWVVLKVLGDRLF